MNPHSTAPRDFRLVWASLVCAFLATMFTPAATVAEPDHGRFKPVGDYLDQLVATGKFPGANVLILKDGKEAYYAQAGVMDIESSLPVRRDTIFRIYSMSKPVTTTAVMILVDEGKLKLSDPVTKYVPEFASLQVYKGMKDGVMLTEPARPMTVENLLDPYGGLYLWLPAVHAGGGHVPEVAPWG